jgi:hypothetical protein
MITSSLSRMIPVTRIGSFTRNISHERAANGHYDGHKETKQQKFDQAPLEIRVTETQQRITLNGDLSGSYETKMRLSQALTEASGKPSWTIDSDNIRVDEGGVEAWAEYVHLLLMDSALTYLPSQLSTILQFDGGVVYKHPRSHFEDV